MDPTLSRRAFLGGAALGLGAGLTGCHAGISRAFPDPNPDGDPDPVGDPAPPVAPSTGPSVAKAPPPPARRMPTAFVGHGSPELARDPGKGGELARWTSGLPRPTAVLVLSAHWEEAPATIGATRPVPLIYDFHGFPEPLYRIRYPAPGAPALADRVEGLLRPHGPVARDPGRGLDHGAWVPLTWMYRQADVPVLPLSLPTQDPASLVRLGRALAPLRDEGVLILGSGNVVHNLRRLGREGATPAWAAEFDGWTADVLTRRDLDALVDYRRKAPAPDLAHPTKEHFVPLLVATAAGLASGGAVSFPIVGFEAGSISRRSLQIG